MRNKQIITVIKLHHTLDHRKRFHKLNFKESKQSQTCKMDAYLPKPTSAAFFVSIDVVTLRRFVCYCPDFYFVMGYCIIKLTNKIENNVTHITFEHFVK